MNLLQFAVAAFIAVHGGNSPCTGLDMPVPADWPAMGKAIAKQLNVRSVEPIRYSALGIWRVFEVNTHSDAVLVAFEAGQMRQPYVLGSTWNGSVAPPETSAGLRKWVHEKVPGMPPRLVDCLTWNLTKKR